MILKRNFLLNLYFSRVMPAGKEWTFERGVRQPLFGYWSIFWGALCEVCAFGTFKIYKQPNKILYVPCAIALYKERRHPCYRVCIDEDKNDKRL